MTNANITANIIAANIAATRRSVEELRVEAIDAQTYANAKAARARLLAYTNTLAICDDAAPLYLVIDAQWCAATAARGARRATEEYHHAVNYLNHLTATFPDARL